MTPEAAEILGVHSEVRDDYSGRCMYGRSTSAAVGSWQDILSAAADILIDIDNYDEREVECVAQALRGLRWDSMGRSDRIFY